MKKLLLFVFLITSANLSAAEALRNSDQEFDGWEMVFEVMICEGDEWNNSIVTSSLKVSSPSTLDPYLKASSRVQSPFVSFVPLDKEEEYSADEESEEEVPSVIHQRKAVKDTNLVASLDEIPQFFHSSTRRRSWHSRFASSDKTITSTNPFDSNFCFQSEEDSDNCIIGFLTVMNTLSKALDGVDEKVIGLMKSAGLIISTDSSKND